MKFVVHSRYHIWTLWYKFGCIINFFHKHYLETGDSPEKIRILLKISVTPECVMICK